MNETCDRCGPGTRAAYRVNRAGELYLCGHCAEPAMDGAFRPGLDHLAAGRARPRAASQCRIGLRLPGRRCGVAVRRRPLSH